MEITESIINRYESVLGRPMIIGVCGRAGAGKTTITKKIADQLREHGINSIPYSGDWRFKLDSLGRKIHFQQRWEQGLTQYMLAVNQFTWWDFDKIYQDLSELSKSHSLVIEDAYDRETGKKKLRVKIPKIRRGVVFYESNILGGMEILEKLDLIILLNTPDHVCFERMIRKDSDRRSITDVAARNIVTTYSENLFYQMLLDNFHHKIMVCDSDGNLGSFPKISEVTQIPVPITSQATKMHEKGTVVCELDGVLIEEEGVEEIEIKKEVAKRLKELKEQGHHLIVTTSRPYHKVFEITNKLRSQGIEVDRVICDLPLGSRILLNNEKWKVK